MHEQGERAEREKGEREGNDRHRMGNIQHESPGRRRGSRDAIFMITLNVHFILGLATLYLPLNISLNEATDGVCVCVCVCVC